MNNPPNNGDNSLASKFQTENPQGVSLDNTSERFNEMMRMRPKITVGQGEEQIEVPQASQRIEIPENNTPISYAEKNSNYFDLTHDLPSKFTFYPYPTLSIRRFGVPEIAKLAEATEYGDFNSVVECISASIDPGLSAFNLTPGDFFYIMHWERINSFKKSPYTIAFICNSEHHINKVISQELPKESLRQQTTIKKASDLEIIHPDVEKANEIHNRVRQEYDILLYPMLVRDYAYLSPYFEELAEIDSKLEDEKTSKEEKQKLKEDRRKLTSKFHMHEYAAYLHPKHGTTLEERVKFLNSLDPEKVSADLLFEIDEFIDACEHGVKETALVECPECKVKVEINVSIDALRFFPKILRSKLAR